MALSCHFTVFRGCCSRQIHGQPCGMIPNFRHQPWASKQAKQAKLRSSPHISAAARFRIKFQLQQRRQQHHSAARAAGMAPSRFRFLCLSDIDGTLVHYLDNPQQLSEVVGQVLWLPTSTTGRQGFISQATLQKAAALRAQGAAFVIVSGARTSTVLQRLPFLPAADAIIAENGGRIWYPDPRGLTACPLQEDLAWRQQLSDVTGPVDQDGVPPLDRQGLLWDWYRQLYREGWKLDASSYSTCFRLMKTPGKSEAEMSAVISSRPTSLSCTENLGVMDFYPTASGKEGAARHLMARWDVSAAATAFLCDDDNDLPLAAVVGKAFLPSVSAASVEAAIAADPDRFVVADVKWTGGTEQMLDAVQQFLLGECGGAQQQQEEGHQTRAEPVTSA